MTSKAKDLDAMLQRKMIATVKRMEELHCLVTEKEAEVLERCEKLDTYLNGKESEAQDKCDKISHLESVIQKIHNGIVTHNGSKK